MKIPSEIIDFIQSGCHAELVTLNPDGGPMLVVVHDRDVEHSLQAFFNFKTARRRDILELDRGTPARE